MAIENKPNSGKIFINDRKSAPNQPDMRGWVHLDRTFLLNLLHKNSDPLVKVSVSAWEALDKYGKKYLSLAAAEPWEPVAQAPRTPIPDDEIPY